MTNVKFRNHFLTNLLNCHKQSFGKTKPSKYVCIIKFTLPFPQFDPFVFFLIAPFVLSFLSSPPSVALPSFSSLPAHANTPHPSPLSLSLCR